MLILCRGIMRKSACQYGALLQRKFTATASPGSGLWHQYNILLERHPLLTKCVTSGFLSFTADILCQVCFTEDPKDMDWLRTAKFTFLGTAFTAPCLHFWYGLLATRIPGKGVTSAIKRLAFDQVLFAPAYIGAFYSAALTLDGTPELIPKKLKTDLKPTVIANFSVWVPCQFINFKFVPPHLQVLWSNMVGFFWNIYLSKLTYRQHHPASTTPFDKPLSSDPENSQ